MQLGLPSFPHRLPCCCHERTGCLPSFLNIQVRVAAVSCQAPGTCTPILTTVNMPRLCWSMHCELSKEALQIRVLLEHVCGSPWGERPRRPRAGTRRGRMADLHVLGGSPRRSSTGAGGLSLNPGPFSENHQSTVP